MGRTIKVEFHCHSNLSDGYFSPEGLAERLAAEGIQVAALTDHDTVEGLDRFRRAAAQRGMAFVPGVEITAEHAGREAHLLAYAFDAANPALQELLRSIRTRRKGASSIGLDRLRLPGLGRNSENGVEAPAGVAATEVLRVVHEAGGRVYLAHPLMLGAVDVLPEAGLRQLKEAGLDGIEAIYGPYPDPVRRQLEQLARDHDLGVSSGSDYHGNELPAPATPGMEIPVEAWKAFRDTLRSPSRRPATAAPAPARAVHRPSWRRFILRIAFPTFLAIALFIWSSFAVVIPTFERSLLDRKRDLIRELTHSAWSVLEEYEREVQAGLLPPEEAREKAIERIRHMRYGAEGKDYFWITDLHPRMVMHPYRPDLDGKDVSGFRDPNDVRIFVEFADAVNRRGEGYVEYVWQWKDDPDRLAAKESYVRGFAPWGWVIGTGLYVDDVRAEIRALTEKLINTSVGISAALVLLLLFAAHQSLRIERERRRTEEDLRESHEKYRALVEAASEGTLMALGGRCTYGNETLLEMLGYSEAEFGLLDLEDLLPGEAAQRSLSERLREEGSAAPVETQLRGKDGAAIDVLLSASPISFGGRDGFILNAKDIRGHKETVAQLGESREQYRLLTDTLHLGVVRARLDECGTLMEANGAARRILGLPASGALEEVTLRDLFHDAEDFANFRRTLSADGALRNRILRVRKSDGTVPVASLSGVLVRDADGAERFFEGVVEDITERKRIESEREDLIAELQTSLLFLNEPVRHAVSDLLLCGMNAPIRVVADSMVAAGRSAAAIGSPSGDVVGIVTDHDLTARVIAGGMDPDRPAYEIMSAPVIAVSEDAPVYEALMLMQERGLRHLAVRNRAGRVISVIRDRELLRFHTYSSAVLAQEAQRAKSMPEIIQCRQRVPRLVKSLIDCGAKPRNITRIITALSDSIVEKVTGFVTEELGPAPVRYAFLALGSEGRQEQTLVTDQDNALLYEDVAAPDSDTARAYFLEFGRRVCARLDEAGYRYCRAETMARNPKWCQPLSEWKRLFSAWINTDDPRDFLDINIFFDLRCVAGDAALARDLRDHIRAAVRDKAVFFHHFAQTVLLYKPPLGLFGQIVVKSSGDAPPAFDIKDAMTPIVNFARIYALRNDLEETNTMDRLLRLREREVLREGAYEEIRAAYDHLMEMRFSHQAEALNEGREADNAIRLEDLTHIEASTLKQVLSQIATIQKKISFDFTGSA